MNLSEPHAIIIVGIVAAVVSLLTVVASMYTVVLTDRLGSIAKEREIKLQSYHKDRIEAVKTLYGLIVELSFSGNKLLNAHNTDYNHTAYKSVITDWLSSFRKVYKYYNKNKILLLENSALSDQVRYSLDKLSPILWAIRKENSDLDQLEEHYAGDLAYNYYDSELDEIEEIRKRLDTLIGDVNVSDMANSFRIIRIDLETYFRELIK